MKKNLPGKKESRELDHWNIQLEKLHGKDTAEGYEKYDILNTIKRLSKEGNFKLAIFYVKALTEPTNPQVAIELKEIEILAKILSGIASGTLKKPRINQQTKERIIHAIASEGMETAKNQAESLNFKGAIKTGNKMIKTDCLSIKKNKELHTAIAEIHEEATGKPPRMREGEEESKEMYLYYCVKCEELYSSNYEHNYYCSEHCKTEARKEQDRKRKAEQRTKKTPLKPEYKSGENN